MFRKLLLVLLACLSTAGIRAQGPAYEWRGIMIDVSRHFMPIDDLKRQIDAMQMCQLNYLHLHLTDAAGWRMEIKKYPRLTQLGAWRTQEKWKDWWNSDRSYVDTQTHPGQPAFGGFYTQRELRQLVAYAAQRGITIVPEIEFPAHSEEVVAAYPQLGFNHAEMDMQKPEVYDFMHDVLTEVASVFPSPYLHLGGDEAATQHDRQPAAMRRLLQMVRSLGRQMIVWDEALTDEPADSDLVIMVWRSPQIATRALALGHRVIFSPGAYCYLDKYQDAPPTQPEAMGGYLPLHAMYDSLCHALTQPALRHPRMLGLQANLWREYIPTVSHAEYMLWPRAFVIAEAGWNGRRMTPDGWEYFRTRALQSIYTLRRQLAIHAFPLSNEVGQRPEYGTPLSRDVISVGHPVHYERRYHDAYTAGGDSALTDGLRGGWSNTDGRWQGFIGKAGMDVVIDLGRKTRISAVQADFMQIVGPDIFLPAHVTISVSQDGQHYTPVFDHDYPDDTTPVTLSTISWDGRIRARYVRYQALPGQRRGWIFCDEVIVRH